MLLWSEYVTPNSCVAVRAVALEVAVLRSFVNHEVRDLLNGIRTLVKKN